MRPIENSQAIVVPVRQKGRHRKALEVFSLEPPLLIGTRESGKGVCPGTPAITVTGLLKLGAHGVVQCVRVPLINAGADRRHCRRRSERHAIDPHRTFDVLQNLVPGVLEHDVQPIADMLAD